MRLVHDLLDKQVLDLNRQRIGRVDGIVLKLEEGKPPVITHIEIGRAALSRRLGQGFGRALMAVLKAFGQNSSQTSFRVPFCKVTCSDIEVQLDLTRGDIPADYWQDWLRDRIVRHLPGGG